MKKARPAAAVTLCLTAALFTLCALPAAADTAGDPIATPLSARTAVLSTGDFVITGSQSADDYTYENGVLRVKAGSPTIAMAQGVDSTSDRIVVDATYSGTLTLDGVSIDRSQAGGCAFALESGASLTLDLAGVNTLTSGGTEAGLHVPAGAALTITGSGDLTARGSGDASNGGAGIGGNGSNISFGTITLNGTGTVTGNGGRAAGIGGGAIQSTSNEVTGRIIINSGTVIGNGGSYAAGIGCSADGGTSRVMVDINGGTVTGNGSGYGAGIGSGLNGSGPAITISGGTVVATSANGAGIGCGGGDYSTNGGSITIAGGSVTASGSPAIGSPKKPADVTLHGGSVTTTGGIRAAGGSITVTGGRISATESALAVGDGSDRVSVGDFDALTPGEGGPVLGGNITVQDGETLTMPDTYPVTITGTLTVENRGRLEVPPAATLTNNGLIQVQPGGTLVNNGSIDGSGSLENEGTLTGSGSLTCKITVNSFSIGNAAPGDYTYENGVLTIHSGALVLQNKKGQDTVTDRIVVDGTYSGTLTLDGVSIDRSQAGGCAFTLESGASLTLDLAGVNTLTSGGTEAGLYVPAGAALTITGSGDLTARGSGDASSGGAGIGGNADAVDFGSITLKGTGIIKAAGGNKAAGIGSGGRTGSGVAASGSVLIESGTVNATSGQNAAAIGSGPDAPCNTIIRITGGTVNAADGLDGAGIGSGWSADGVGAIEITGGVVTATGTGQGVGIGKPGGSQKGGVTIRGGTVTAKGGASQPDIACTLLTGPDGQAVIRANSIQFTGNQAEWSCLLVGDSSAAWHGTSNHIICDSELNLGSASLTIPAGSSLTVKGMMRTYQSSGLIVEGSLDAQYLDLSFTPLTVAEGASLHVSESFSLRGSCKNQGSMTLEAPWADFYGEIVNSGTLVLVNTHLSCNHTAFTNTATGVIEVEGGMFSVFDSGFVNNGLLLSTDGGIIHAVDDYECRIRFDGNGGTPKAADLITENRVLTALPEAERSGYVLEGWYTAAEGGDKIAPDHAFTQGVTLYAHWSKAPATPAPTQTPTVTPVPTTTPAPSSTPAPTAAPAVEEDPSPAEHTLRFETNGGFPAEEVRIGRGAVVELWPYTPTRIGYLFAGWYADAALTRPVTKVLMTADQTVYAAWTADPAASAGQAGGTSGSVPGGGKATATPAPAATPEPVATATPAPTATPESTPAPQTTPTPQTTPDQPAGMPLWPFAAAGGAVVLAGAVVFLLMRRR